MGVSMSNIPWLRAGNRNMRGKKTLAIMAGTYVEDTLYNRKEVMLKNVALAEMREGMVGG
jgi:hypothetical protein